MTEIERKALALLNEATGSTSDDIEDFSRSEVFKALFRAIEQHEAFRQEVSDAVEAWVDGGIDRPAYIWFRKNLERFILPKPVDPLVEALHDCGVDRFETWADQLRAALAARGLKIVEDKP